MPVDHYENFPVASVLMPRRLVPAVEAIYAFARSADDLADEGDATPEQRLAALGAYEASLARIERKEDGLDPMFTRLAATIAKYDALAKEQAQKKQDVMAQANADQKNYDALNYRDDQFDLSDALLAIAISMLAVSSLTQLLWLYLLSLFPAACGVLMGVAGLTGLHLHPDKLTALLS